MPLSQGRRLFNIPVAIYLVILLGLFYMFHTELFVTGVRLYVLAVDNSRAERLLGDYYQNSASLNNELARNFYGSAMKKYKEALLNTTLPANKVACIKFTIGQLYQCGKGVLPYPLEAKHWYTEALAAAEEAAKQHEPINEQMLKNLNEALATTEQSIKMGTTPPPCPLQSDGDFLINTFQMD